MLKKKELTAHTKPWPLYLKTKQVITYMKVANKERAIYLVPVPTAYAIQGDHI